jgi:iron complex transport system substrate-binding protein
MKHILVVTFLLVFLSSPALAETPARIVSLAPNITEILYDLGLEGRIVAVTSFCDYPLRAKAKPKIGGMTNPSLEAIVAVRPDLVIMTDDGNPLGFDNRLQALGIKSYVFRARNISELPNGIRDLGIALDVKKMAYKRAEIIEKSIEQIKKRPQHNPVYSAPKVLFIVQPVPLIVAGPGTAIDDALKIIGLQNIAANAGSRYPNYSLEEVFSRKPDIIIIGRGPGMSNEYADDILNKLKSLDAVRKGRVCYINDPLFRLGPRIIEGIRDVEACIKHKQK